MIKILASFLTVYSQLASAQAPPFQAIPQIPAVPSNPQVPAVVVPPEIIPPNVQIPAVVTEPPIIEPVVVIEPVIEPPVAVIEPPVAVTEPPVAVTEPPVAVTEPPIVVTNPPIVVTNPPIVVTEPPPPPTRPLLRPNIFYGHYGQQCDYNKSPLKDVVCKAAGGIAIEQYPGFMKCERGYDCCLCETITCGNTWEGCNTFSAGDSGVAGVQDIQILGRSEQLGGAVMNFIGIESGVNAVVSGENIKTLNAAGPLALRNAHVTIRNPIRDFSIECSGLAACQDATIEVVLPGPPPGYACNPAWNAGPLEFNQISCSGPQSCLNTKIIIRNEGCRQIEIQQIECVLGNSCMNTQFEIIGAVSVNSCDVQNAYQPVYGLGLCYGQQQVQQPGKPAKNGQWVPL